MIKNNGNNNWIKKNLFFKINKIDKIFILFHYFLNTGNLQFQGFIQ